jgi:hypothetical protein
MIDMMVKCFVEYPVWSYGVLAVAAAEAVINRFIDR